MKQKLTEMSKMRKIYFARLIFRMIVFAAVVGMYLQNPEEFYILYGDDFFKELSWLHVLWFVWIVDMIWQIVPLKGQISLGSQKLFKHRFKPIREKINYQALREYVVSTTKAAYKVFLIWTALTLTLGVFYYMNIMTAEQLFLVCVAFYVCDLICVLIWCPFRLIMKNRCCTTCRIFNWDHLMMFTPMLFVNSFYSVSLILFAFAVWVVWELCVMMYPERFWEQTNASLKCSECTDKLCTQYCRKLRK